MAKGAPWAKGRHKLKAVKGRGYYGAKGRREIKAAIGYN